MNFHEIFGSGSPWDKEQLIRYWGDLFFFSSNPVCKYQNYNADDFSDEPYFNIE